MDEVPAANVSVHLLTATGRPPLCEDSLSVSAPMASRAPIGGVWLPFRVNWITIRPSATFLGKEGTHQPGSNVLLSERTQ